MIEIVWQKELGSPNLSQQQHKPRSNQFHLCHPILEPNRTLRPEPHDFPNSRIQRLDVPGSSPRSLLWVCPVCALGALGTKWEGKDAPPYRSADEHSLPYYSGSLYCISGTTVPTSTIGPRAPQGPTLSLLRSSTSTNSAYST